MFEEINFKIFIAIITVLILIVAGVFYLQKDSLQENNPELIVGGDQDIHGCIGSAGYSWCESKGKCVRVFEEFCLDNVLSIIDSLGNYSGVYLESLGENEFNWFFKKEEEVLKLIVSGVAYVAEEVSRENYEKIEEYMNNNFELDSYNIADGVVGGLRGYYVNYMVCNLSFEHEEMEENDYGLLEPKGDNLNVRLDCGYFNKNDYN